MYRQVVLHVVPGPRVHQARSDEAARPFGVDPNLGACACGTAAAVERQRCGEVKAGSRSGIQAHDAFTRTWVAVTCSGTPVGVQVALLEVSGLLGLQRTSNEPLIEIVHDLRLIGEANPYAVCVSLAVLAVILGGKRISDKIPGGLIAVVAAIGVSWAMDLGAHLETLGEVPSGLPTLALPHVEWSWVLIQKLLPIAFACFVVILAQSAATSRAYAAKYNDRFDENVDMVGLGMANLGAGLSGTFIVNGSPTNTAMVDSGGGRSQVSQLTASGIVLVVLLFLTGPLAHLPTAVLSAIVFLVAVKMIDVRGMRRIFIEARAEFWVALLTAATVVVIGVEQGILLAMVLSLLDHVRRGYRGNNAIIAADKKRKGWQMVALSEPQQIAPGLLVYLFSHSLYLSLIHI